MNTSDITYSPTLDVGDEVNERAGESVKVQTGNSVLSPIARKRIAQAAEDTAKVSNDDRKTSKIWGHFTPVKYCDIEFSSAACNYCNGQYATYPKRIDTSSCWNHLQNKCKKFSHRASPQKQKLLNFQKAQEYGGTSLVTWKFDKIKKNSKEGYIWDDHSNWVAIQVSWTWVFFFKFFAKLCPQIKLTSRKTILQEIVWNIMLKRIRH